MSALATKIGHEINPDFKIGCMIAGSPIYPLTSNPKDILEAMKKIAIPYFLRMFMPEVNIQLIC